MTVPAHLQDGLQRYLDSGTPPGHFLLAVLSNDLRGACNRGDDAALAGLVDLVRYLYNHAPASAWGSPERVEAWMERRAS